MATRICRETPTLSFLRRPYGTPLDPANAPPPPPRVTAPTGEPNEGVVAVSLLVLAVLIALAVLKGAR